MMLGFAFVITVVDDRQRVLTNLSKQNIPQIALDNARRLLYGRLALTTTLLTRGIIRLSIS